MSQLIVALAAWCGLYSPEMLTLYAEKTVIEAWPEDRRGIYDMCLARASTTKDGHMYFDEKAHGASAVNACAIVIWGGPWDA